mgnify:FL=1
MGFRLAKYLTVGIFARGIPTFRRTGGNLLFMLLQKNNPQKTGKAPDKINILAP